MAQFDRSTCGQDYVIESRQFPGHFLTRFKRDEFFDILNFLDLDIQWPSVGTFNGQSVGMEQVYISHFMRVKDFYL